MDEVNYEYPVALADQGISVGILPGRESRPIEADRRTHGESRWWPGPLPPIPARIQAGLAALLLAGITPSLVRAAEAGLEFRGGPTRTALVELYTSEGCSSCPPAEAWLNRLGSLPGLWSEFVPVAMHVNYWDHLGWRDPWASRELTERQRAYASSWRSNSVYTPALVLNGQEWRAWSGHRDIPRSTENPGVLTARSNGGVRWQIEFSPAEFPRAFEASVALLSRRVESNVRAG